MSYATQADLETRFGTDEITMVADRNGDGVIDVAVVAAALSAATRKINSYIGRRYGLPEQDVPGVLVDVCCDMARFYLHKDGPTEAINNAHKEALNFLSDVSRGIAELSIAGKEIAADTTGAPQTNGSVQIFTKDSMKGF